MPQNFLTALNDMPVAGGNALGIDRLVMLFADTTLIDDVVAFVPEEL
jgi:lysyl-tRNA synthetase class 2